MSNVQPVPAAPPAPVEFRYTQTDSFATVLRELRASLAITTYQANKLLVARATDDGLSMLVRTFDRPMGLAIRDGRMALGCRSEVWQFRNAPAIAPLVEPARRHDACFVPRTSHVTGDIGVHELAWAGDELWAVNTRFSCLCTLDHVHSFVPRWRPPFVSELAAQDRCHLNGLAMRDGSPAYVSLFARTDAPRGWRELPTHSGAVLDVASGEPVATGLTMPHSPRWHRGNLFVLNSGMGRLERVDLATGQREAIAAVPGYARGLALHGNLAFVGLSRIRETAIFGGVPIAEYHEQLRCGVGVIELDTGNTVATLSFETAVEEIFDVQAVPGSRCPTFGGSSAAGDEVWLLPDPRTADSGSR
jgi:uncharacterized protein (TIGR03032 family)